jgi:hypothetical protein
VTCPKSAYRFDNVLSQQYSNWRVPPAFAQLRALAVKKLFGQRSDRPRIDDWKTVEHDGFESAWPMKYEQAMKRRRRKARPRPRDR